MSTDAYHEYCLVDGDLRAREQDMLRCSIYAGLIDTLPSKLAASSSAEAVQLTNGLQSTDPCRRPQHELGSEVQLVGSLSVEAMVGCCHMVG